MFALKKQKCQIAHLNIRTEKHGEDEVLAEDVKVAADMPNSFLDLLSPGLRAALYASAPGATGDMLDADHLPHLRFSQLGTLTWGSAMKAAMFTIHGAKKADDLTFECDIKKLKFTPKDGGTVAIEFSAGILPEASQTGLLAEMLSQEVKVSIVPGKEIPAVADDGGDGSGGEGGPDDTSQAG